MENLDKISYALGEVLIHLQTFEFMLRVFLYESIGPEDETLNLHKLTVGDWVQENPITNYDTLGQLIINVNNYLDKQNISDRIDYSLVEVRDALAHGRTIAHQSNGPFTLMKFSSPKQGKVQVTAVVELNEKWLAQQTERIITEIQKIIRIAQSFGFTNFSS